MDNTIDTNNSLLSRSKLIFPIFIGLIVIAWMLFSATQEQQFYAVEKGEGNYVWRDANANNLVDYNLTDEFVASQNGDYKLKTFREALGELDFNFHFWLWIILAFAMMLVRDLAYMWRIRIMTDHQLSWRQSMNVILIWEFASAITPGVVGGAAFAIFILRKENISLGKSSALVIGATFLDELFYVLVVPLCILLAGMDVFFPLAFSQSFFGMDWSMHALFWLAYGVIVIITLLLSLGLFIWPMVLAKFIASFGKLFFLKRYNERFTRMGAELVSSSQSLKSKKLSFWMKAFLATMISWTGRFLVINCLLMAFLPSLDHLLVFARQLSMWVILLVSPTPGGSGIAEFAFSGYLKDVLPFGLVAIIALCWRFITYYLYLIIGAVCLPLWLNKKSSN